MRERNLLWKKFRAGVLIIISILLIAVVQPISAETAPEDEIVLDFSFQEPVITEVNISNTTYHRVTMQGLPLLDAAGCPLLPVKPVRVLLPQKSILDSIDVSYKKNISLGYRFNVELGSEEGNITSEEQNESNVPINFDYTEPYPTEVFHNFGIYNFRGYTYLLLNLYPVHYVWETGEIYYYGEMTVSIKVLENGSVSSSFRNSSKDRIILKHTVDDTSRLYTYNITISQTNNSMLVNNSYSYDYVIITTETLKNSDGEYTFQDLTDYKNTTGVKTTIVTVEEIMNEPYYMNTTNYLYNDTPARIRNFIIDAYKNWGIEYVLIGGDDNVIPARHICYFHDDDFVDQPSDLYYACLDGIFNYDEDYLWGEPNDGENGEDIDIFAEVYVGRACVGNSEEVSNFVSKTLFYAETFDPYIKKVLMAGEEMESGWGGDELDKLIKVFPEEYPYNYNILTLYDRDYKPDGWDKSSIINKINNNLHIINHVGHSSKNSNMKLTTQDVGALTNDKPCFIYSQGCSAGYFPVEDCIAEYFTVKNNNGAFAGIWNARKGICGPSGFFQREFWDAIFDESITEIGKANQDSKEDVFFMFSRFYRNIYFGLNLFGDPQLSIKPAVIPEHDLAVNKLDIKEYQHVPSNQTFKVNARILNKGKNNETNVTVNLTVDGNVEDNLTINLTRNTADIVCFDCLLAPGIRNIEVEVKSVTGENITGDNILNRTVIAGPDVALTDLDVFPPIYINSSNQINITVGNLGTTDVNDVNISLSIDDEVVNWTVISSLSSGEIVVKSFDWSPQYSKWYNISAFVHPVTDENYSINNYYNMSVHPVNHTVYVDDDGGADFETIQEAIYWVGDGDIVYVQNGTYYENVSVYKSINLTGEDKNSTIIDGNGSGYVLRIYNSNGINITGFTIRNICGTAVKVRSNCNNISGNIISTTPNSTSYLGGGIALIADNNIVTKNIISNLNYTGVLVNSNDNIISENVITNITLDNPSIQPPAGIKIGDPLAKKKYCSFNYIVSNNISKCKRGILIFETSNNNIFWENKITNNTEEGIRLHSCFNNFAKNDIYGNSNGVYTFVATAHNNTFSENNIVNNSIGVKIKKANENVFIGNNFSDNEEGVNITLSANYNVFHHNNFINNSQNAYDECENYWDNGSIGNYWSDFDEPSEGAYDNDSNGIVDDPYDIPGGDNQDGYPLINISAVPGSEPGDPAKPTGTTIGHVYNQYYYNSTSTDPDGDELYYHWAWGDGSGTGWIGPYVSGSNVSGSHWWGDQGSYRVRVKVKDNVGLESDWSEALLVKIENRQPDKPPEKPKILDGWSDWRVGKPIRVAIKNTTDPDDDDVYYRFEWGDGSWSGWLQNWCEELGDYTEWSHAYYEKGWKEIRVKAKEIMKKAGCEKAFAVYGLEISDIAEVKD